MNEIRQKIAEKKQEIKEKYADLINEIASVQLVDAGVAFDMLLAICRGGDYKGDLEIDTDELKADYAELVGYEEELLKALGF